MNEKRYHPLWNLVICRLRMFYREPVAVFWTYGFPLVMITSLGLAFRETPKTTILVDVVGPQAAPMEALLGKNPQFKVSQPAEGEWKKRLQNGKTQLVVETGQSTTEPARFWVEPHRAESLFAREAVENVILRSEAARNAPEFSESHLEEVGSRYIDFLLPGMIGMNLMGGGLWGIGFVLVDMRVRKLFKRLLATPMRHSDFMLALLASRLLFLVPEMLVIFFAGRLWFGVPMYGSYVTLIVVILVGAAAFAGLGLLLASRTEKTEAISAYLNLVMLPSYLLSGVFFSSKRFPDVVQPVIQALPLTQLNDALREVMLEEKDFTAVGWRIAILAAWAVVCFALALRWFRWR